MNKPTLVEHADRLPLEQSDNQIVMQECGSAGAPNELQGDIKADIKQNWSWIFQLRELIDAYSHPSEGLGYLTMCQLY